MFANLTGKPWIIVKVSIFNRLANWLWLNNSVNTVTSAPQNWWIADLLLLRTSLEAPVWPKVDFRLKRDAIDITFTYLKSRSTICIWNVFYAEKLGTLLAEGKRHLLNYEVFSTIEWCKILNMFSCAIGNQTNKRPTSNFLDERLYKYPGLISRWKNSVLSKCVCSYMNSRLTQAKEWTATLQFPSF